MTKIITDDTITSSPVTYDGVEAHDLVNEIIGSAHVSNEEAADLRRIASSVFEGAGACPQFPQADKLAKLKSMTAHNKPRAQQTKQNANGTRSGNPFIDMITRGK